MKTKRIGLILAATSLLVGASVAFSQTAMNIDPNYHRNLANAQAQIRQAYNFISQAQLANHDQLSGHAENAKRLLQQAADELKAAALTANAEGH
ncbi:hypothetical protein QZM22_30680 [Burkholderia oklahomensis]|uniref:hypothetical protein n=1 Tax=Burkholderia oklahomensis TaxID=342113 RepID=UPI00264B0C75|nr:hypothetical protein [Burkholderia oklahomensis]MDN7676726.1 hypothetical protein [Burkholderia oklahomensis]